MSFEGRIVNLSCCTLGLSRRLMNNVEKLAGPALLGGACDDYFEMRYGREILSLRVFIFKIS